MHELLQNGYHEFNTSEFWITLESLRDLVELGFIIEQLECHADNPKFRAVISRLMEDNPLPQNDRINSRGRDAHWELYLAAVCQRAAMTPVGFEGSDVTCTVEGTLIGIEAKRIKSERSAKKRIKKAIDQVISSSRPGIVALDMSLAWNEQNRPILGAIHNAFLDRNLSAQANLFYERHRAWIEGRCAGKDVLGIVIFNFVMRLVGDSWCPHRHAFWVDLTTTPNQRRLFETFESQFCNVTPNRMATIEGIS